MKKKMLAVFGITALMAVGASMTSYAKGWEQLKDGRWVYLDSYGDRVFEEWQKSGDLYYWLDEDGIMATNRIVDDGQNIYYVNGEGARSTNLWIGVTNWDDEEVNGSYVGSLWYYFGDNGKAYRSSEGLVKKSIGNSVYFFDENGHMASGWVDYSGDTYYCGAKNQGWALSGWQHLEPREGIRDRYDDKEWFYFGDGFKMRKSTNSYIDNVYYSFDKNGVMQDDWHTSNGMDSHASEDGSLSTGWLYTADRHDDGEYHWYYMVTVRENGKVTRAVPFNSTNRDGKRRAKYIDGKTFLFNSDGTMVTGLVELGYKTPGTTNEGSSCKELGAGLYYFNEDGGSDAGKMMTGKVTYNFEGDTSYYYFGSDGRAVKAQLRDNTVYGEDGSRIQAEDGNTYTLVELDYPICDSNGNEKIKAGTTFAVSETGKLRTSGTVKIDGEYYDINRDTYEAVLDTSR